MRDELGGERIAMSRASGVGSATKGLLEDRLQFVTPSALGVRSGRRSATAYTRRGPIALLVLRPRLRDGADLATQPRKGAGGTAAFFAALLPSSGRGRRGDPRSQTSPRRPGPGLFMKGREKGRGKTQGRGRARATFEIRCTREGTVGSN